MKEREEINIRKGTFIFLCFKKKFRIDFFFSKKTKSEKGVCVYE